MQATYLSRWKRVPTSWTYLHLYRSRSLSSVSSNRTLHETPIVIVGGGPSGLCLSNLLSLYDTPHVLLEALSPGERFQHPQAHFLNTRTMEILRNYLPDVHERIRLAMPHVSEWQYFNFGYSMSAEHTMARVRHPVDRPLQSQVNSNGVLVPSTGDDSPGEYTIPDGSVPLSDCTVGHLAQHTFCSVLYDNALQKAGPDTHIRYDQRVSHVERHRSGLSYSIHASSKSDVEYSSAVLVAADGASSELRRSLGIATSGNEGIQHLINVHVRTESSLARTFPSAMLYSIFNQKLVGMMVRHSEGEYVLQIPYFPPYQTLERNFSAPQVMSMVEAAFGTSNGVEIVSIRPWTMSSLVADKYFDGYGGVLVGDAAHVFPPAGGFGMNTGLQDVHNLAWRLALWHQKRSEKSQFASQQTLVSQLTAYEKERRPVGQRNAALSVRNYRRILQLSSACYLNNQHPAALISLLNGMSALFSLETRQNLFQHLLETAMLPLSTLKNPLTLPAQHLIGNVRRILGRGGGLPLLFPKFEIGFTYSGETLNASEPDENVGQEWERDTNGFIPRIAVGSLFPHAELEVVSSIKDSPQVPTSTTKASQDSIETISSRDLPARLCVGSPCFALMLFDWNDETPLGIACSLSKEAVTPIVPVQVICANEESLHCTSARWVLRDRSSTLASMMGPSGEGMAVLVRPDGHVASITRAYESSKASPILLRDLLA